MERACREKVVKLLVAHFISFKGCETHASINEDRQGGMKTFVDYRSRFKLPDPDFARDEYLPPEARANNEPDMLILNLERKTLKTSLSHSSSTEWRKVGNHSFRRALTGMNEGEDVRLFHIGSGDLMHHPLRSIQNMAKGSVTVDIDSVLLLFTDLSLIQCTIDISMIWSPWRNLSSSVHITYCSIPVHRIPHFFLGRFGRELQFDLYLLAPRAYDKAAKMKYGKIPNRLTEETIAAFMDHALLRAIHDCVPPTQSNQWPSRYEIQKAKSLAHGMEGHLHGRTHQPRHMELTVPLMEQYIPSVWAACVDYLNQEIKNSNPKLSVLEEFRLFACSKNTKDRFFTETIPELMSTFKHKVS
jgi:hypothetical protein